LYTYDELSGDSNAILKWSGAPRFLGSNRCLYNSFQIYCGGVCAGNIRLLRMGADRRLLRCGCHDCTEELNGDGMTYGPAVSMYYNIVRSPGNFSINAVLDSLKKVHRYPYSKSYTAYPFHCATCKSLTSRNLPVSLLFTQTITPVPAVFLWNALLACNVTDRKPIFGALRYSGVVSTLHVFQLS
jgi:hypothetical protein